MARAPALPYKVTFRSPRRRRAVSLALGLAAATALIALTGPVSQGIGALLLVVFLWTQGRPLLDTLRHPIGIIAVGRSTIGLPQGLHSEGSFEVTPDDLDEVYFLRRAVTFSQGAPLLVVETKDHKLVYPRDWFDDEDAQESAYLALRKHVSAPE